ncbi:MAG TPA: hypothetical protein DDZ88_27165 [Verrucomicrobiales bacterium]|nr:hypothetical protein [Verrucomicrobiales bacterium]
MFLNEVLMEIRLSEHKSTTSSRLSQAVHRFFDRHMVLNHLIFVTNTDEVGWIDEEKDDLSGSHIFCKRRKCFGRAVIKQSS